MTSSFVAQPKALPPTYCQTPWGPGILGLSGVLIQGPSSTDKRHLPGALHIPSTKTIPPDRIQALINCPLPKTKRELLSVLGLLNFFHIWIPDFSLQSCSMRQLKDVWVSPSLTPPRWPILFASSPRASSECQLSTCQITPDHSFSLPVPTKDRPWDFYASGPETPGLP